MHITTRIAMIVFALVALAYGVSSVLKARKWLSFWDEFVEDGEAVDFVSRRGLKKSAFRSKRKKRPYRSAYFGIVCIVFGICVIIAALGNLFF